MTIFISAIAVAMIVSFLCSVMEAALLSLNPGKLAVIAKKSPKIGKICAVFKDDIEKPIAVILILNTSAHTFGASIAGAQFDHLWGKENIWLFSLIFTIFMVQYTEILPKTLGVRFNSFVIYSTAKILKFFVKIMHPLIWLIKLINYPFESKKEKSNANQETLDELDALTLMALETEQISVTQAHALLKISDLQCDLISEIMITAENIVSINKDMTLNEVLQVINKYQHARYPVKDNGKEGDFIGLLEIRDLLFLKDNNWQKLIKNVAVINNDITQLHIAENIVKLDSKLLLVKNKENKIIGMVTINNLVMKLFPK